MRKETTLISYLFGLQRFGWKLELTRIKRLLDRLGNPERRFKSIHIAGTNGKGSVAASLASILNQAGIKTALYTSPHLVDPEERIVVNNKQITRDQFISFIEQFREYFDQYEITFFEAMTAIAFYFFAEQHVELAVIETGLGGRFDATNVIAPVLTIITEITLDHTEHLGTTYESIAREKAGIIKHTVPCLTSISNNVALSVVRETARQENIRLDNIYDSLKIDNMHLSSSCSRFDISTPKHKYQSIETPLIGEHQVINTALAIAAVDQLKGMRYQIDNAAVHEGLRNVSWPGRIQVLKNKPTVVFDVAHNPAAIDKTIAAIRTLFKYNKLIVVVSLMRDKDISEIIKKLAEVAHEAVTVTSNTNRSAEAEMLYDIFVDTGVTCTVKESPRDGCKYALNRADEKDLILITGTHYLAGDVFGLFYEKKLDKKHEN